MENLEGEIWKGIVGIEADYEVSNFGRVKNVYKNKIRNTNLGDKNCNSFHFICACRIKYWVHEAVINSFYPETIGKTLNIKHKDGIKGNNHIDNLEWEIIPDINISLFTPIKGYEDLYSISIDGKIISHFLSGRVTYVKMNIGKNGYITYQLWKDNRGKHKKAHRLIAETFISNPENKPDINHKNGIKTDNRIENLEWVTRKENMQHALKNGLVGKPRQRKVINTNTGIIYDTLREASNNIGRNEKSTWLKLNGKLKNNTPLQYT